MHLPHLENCKLRAERQKVILSLSWGNTRVAICEEMHIMYAIVGFTWIPSQGPDSIHIWMIHSSIHRDDLLEKGPTNFFPLPLDGPFESKSIWEGLLVIKRALSYSTKGLFHWMIQFSWIVRWIILNLGPHYQVWSVQPNHVLQEMDKN